MTIIKPMTDGPLVAQGIPNLKDPVGTDVKPEKLAFGLCRCGQSKNKPFCDVSHTAAGFSLDNGDAKLRNTSIQYTGQVEGKSVTVSYTPVLCGILPNANVFINKFLTPAKSHGFSPKTGTLRGSFQ